MKRLLLICTAVCTLLSCRSYNIDLDFSNECGDGFINGSLLFVVDTAGGKGFCHVGITECIDTASYVYEIQPQTGIVRIPFEEFAVEWYYKFDTSYGFPSYVKYYYVEKDIDEAALFSKLSEYMKRPKYSIDEVSMVRDCYVTSNGKPVFSSKDSTLTLIANSPALFNYRIE